MDPFALLISPALIFSSLLLLRRNKMLKKDLALSKNVKNALVDVKEKIHDTIDELQKENDLHKKNLLSHGKINFWNLIKKLRI